MLLKSFFIALSLVSGYFLWRLIFDSPRSLFGSRPPKRSVRKHYNLSSIQLDLSYYRDATTNKLKTHRVRDLIANMYIHGWRNYMKYGYPQDDLAPLSCSGKMSIGTRYLTLIDAADGLAILGEIEEFREAIRHISLIPNFDIDVKVSVFETTIRILGGLLSSHVLAKKHLPEYKDALLSLAVDLGDRLIPAFNTPTGVNFGSINLRHGVLESESTITCTACAALSMEFGYLSHLTGNHTYYKVSKASMKYIWENRSPLNLLGTYFDIGVGKWQSKTATIGAELDSYYEYLWKSYILFHDEDFLVMFQSTYDAIEQHLRCGQRHISVHMETGIPIDTGFQALQSFWSGLQAGLGELTKAASTMRLMNEITRNYKFIPEKIYLTPYSTTPANYYLLRPELVESIYFLNSAMQHPWLHDFGFEILQRLYNHTLVPCGFTGIRNVETMERIDHMESFFLAETLKYLYLLFDKENPITVEPHIFTTEAHPLPLHSWDKHMSNFSFASIHPSIKNPSQFTCDAIEYKRIESQSPLVFLSSENKTAHEEMLGLASCLIGNESIPR